ncbi:fumarylacetoacetate hydrolase family protein [Roseovarius pelagicus]|uniref:Fumarylacetoacetate hydrolase family protein n=1 Tax=Roseovarius pelagicus TaxID=2980108 RepID=A0ABY6DF56_9RHOB|nr:fumarylacetoacetate hydrolase family protein [Roseovarius pelagicus]UXX84474.1 fumarylacetoacetate hydrolase family protein [Roseovarius pelagicus]
MPANMLFDLPAAPAVPITGSDALFPVRRIFCVGRNYAAHAAEMGNEVDREAPFYFTKSAHALILSGTDIAYPPGTSDCHYEMEFVMALGAAAFEATVENAMQAVYGYACGIDLTRRDLQAAAKDKRRPWDLGKDFENAAIMAAITPATEFGLIADQAITLDMDGTRVQDATLSDMIWSAPEIIAHLSRFYHLSPGDLIYTGTPAGVGPVAPGATLKGQIDGLSPVELGITR